MTVSVSYAQLGLFVSVNFPRKCYCSEIVDFGPVLILYHHASQILNVSSPVGSVVYYGASLNEVFSLPVCQSLLNPLYEGSLPPVYIITLLMGVWAFFSSGGSQHGLNAVCTRKTRHSHTKSV